MSSLDLWQELRGTESAGRLTALWGAVFAVMTVSHVIAGAIDHRGTNIIFNWAIPIALVLWGVKQSKPSDDAPVVHQQA